MNIESVYEKFQSDVLPKIQEGLSITKDYFMDLASRYVSYLFWTDVAAIVMCFILFAVALPVGIKVLKKGIKIGNERRYDTDGFGITMGGVIIIVVSIMGGLLPAIINSFDLIKVLTVPEIRILEDFNSYTRSHK